MTTTKFNKTFINGNLKGISVEEKMIFATETAAQKWIKSVNNKDIKSCGGSDYRISRIEFCR